ncbi:MAG: hypothetical protein H6843_07215 [Rhodospirillaceae bacterium]|nr:hypothetical protein [Rhodospirillaceae bacterium]
MARGDMRAAGQALSRLNTYVVQCIRANAQVIRNIARPDPGLLQWIRDNLQQAINYLLVGAGNILRAQIWPAVQTMLRLIGAILSGMVEVIGALLVSAEFWIFIALAVLVCWVVYSGQQNPATAQNLRTLAQNPYEGLLCHFARFGTKFANIG